MLLGGFRLLWHSDYAGGCAALIWSDWKLRLSWSSALVSTWPPRFRQHAGGFMLCCWIVEAMARQCSGTVSYGCLTSDEISLFILADFAADVRMLWLIVMVNRTMTYLCLFFFFFVAPWTKTGASEVLQHWKWHLYAEMIPQCLHKIHRYTQKLWSLKKLTLMMTALFELEEAA